MITLLVLKYDLNSSNGIIECNKVQITEIHMCKIYCAAKYKNINKQMK